jgi:hypothetical protein
VRAATALAAVLLAASPAAARMHAGPNVLHAGHRLQGAIAPLDGGGAFASPAGAYSLRRLKSTYTGPGIKLRRTTGGTQDINFLGFSGFSGAPLDVAAAAAFCNATTCFADTWYDQSGNARHVTQTTAANQPQFIFNCNGSLPCLRVTTATQELDTVASLAVASPLSMSAVGNRSSGTGTCTPIFMFFNYIYTQPSFPNWVLRGLTDLSTATAADAVWHAALGVIAGVATVMRIDGAEVTGSVAIQAGSGTIISPWNGTAGTNCDWTETLIWNGYALAAAERAALTQSQRNFWGF